MFKLEGNLTLKQVVEQGFEEIRQSFLEQLKKTIEGLLEAERDRRVGALRQQGEKAYRWGYTVRKCWTTLWGALPGVRVPRWSSGIQCVNGRPLRERMKAPTILHGLGNID